MRETARREMTVEAAKKLAPTKKRPSCLIERGENTDCGSRGTSGELVTGTTGVA